MSGSSAVNPAYCEVAGRGAEELVGRLVFDVFPDAPGNDGDGPDQLGDALRRVVERGEPETIALQRYDIEEPGTGRFVEHHWCITNVPLLDPDGKVTHLIIHPEEVTTYIDERVRRAPLGAGARSSQVQAVETVVTDLLADLRQVGDLAMSFVSCDSVQQVAETFLGAGLDLAGATGGSFVDVGPKGLSIIGHRGIDSETVARSQALLVERRGEILDEGMARLRAVAATGGQAGTSATALYRALHPTGRHDDDIAILLARLAPASGRE